MQAVCATFDEGPSFALGIASFPGGISTLNVTDFTSRVQKKILRDCVNDTEAISQMPEKSGGDVAGDAILI